VLSITNHLQRNRYGDFLLTQAIRPGSEVPVVPLEGYRRTIYRDPYTEKTMPMLSVAVGADRLFEVFLDLTQLLGEVTHVILESSHDGSVDSIKCARRLDIDTPVLASYCYEFEDLLLNDGCTAISVLAHRREVQLDEHKLINVYGRKLRRFRETLDRHGIPERPGMKLICEAEHLHHSTCRFQDEFHQLAERIGAEEPAPVLSDDRGW
jgi:hypothetical protein